MIEGLAHLGHGPSVLGPVTIASGANLDDMAVSGRPRPGLVAHTIRYSAMTIPRLCLDSPLEAGVDPVYARGRPGSVRVAKPWMKSHKVAFDVQLRVAIAADLYADIRAPAQTTSVPAAFPDGSKPATSGPLPTSIARRKYLRRSAILPTMGEGRLRYQPGLDGLRGLALVAMLAFHDGRLRGGFLGLSTFFTLSGFLITGLLVSERSASGRVSLRRFFARRFRRLLPAALIGLVVAGAVTVVLHDAQTSRNFRFDTLGAGSVALTSTVPCKNPLWSMSVQMVRASSLNAVATRR
jgi:hypothetical protein